MRPIIQVIAIAVIVVFASASGTSSVMAQDKAATSSPVITPVAVSTASQPNPSVTKNDIENAKSLMQERLRNQENIFDEKIGRVTDRLDKQDIYIGNILSFADKNSNVITMFAAFIAIAALISYAFTDWKAQRQIESWIKKDGKITLDDKIQNEVAKSTIKFEERLKHLENMAEKKIDKIISSVSKSIPHRSKEEAPQSFIDDLGDAVDDIEDRPDSEKGYRDWIIMASSSYFSGNKDNVYEYLNKAFSSNDINDLGFARAKFFQAGMLSLDGEYENSLESLYEVLNKFLSTEDDEIKDALADIQNAVGDTLRNLAKKIWNDSEKNKDAVPMLLKSINNLDYAISNGSGDAPMHAISNKAYALFLTAGNTEEVRGLLRKSFSEGGKHQYMEVSKDVLLNHLPQDDEYKEIIDDVWAEVQAEKDKPAEVEVEE